MGQVTCRRPSVRVVAILLLAMVACLATARAAKADISGSFAFDISLMPQTTTAEMSKFDFDFEGLLELNITLSGLTFGNDLALGIAGMEHYIASLSATLGALKLLDEFAFAAPYNKYLERIGGLLFVKKRVTLAFTVGGLTFKNLVIFEDVNFPSPQTYHESIPYTAGDQKFRFGSIITVSGTTGGGIKVTSITGICADPQKANVIKKKVWTGRACDNEKLGFTVEKLILSDISVAGIKLRSETEFRPEKPISQRLSVSFTVAGLFKVSTSLRWDDIAELNISGGTVTLSSPPFTISNSFDTRQLSTSVIASLKLQGMSLGVYSTFRTYQDREPPYAIHFFELKGFKLHAFIYLGKITFGALALWDGADAPPVVFDYVRYTLGVRVAPHNKLEMSAKFMKDGFERADISFTSEFEF